MSGLKKLIVTAALLVALLLPAPMTRESVAYSPLPLGGCSTNAGACPGF